MPLLARGRSISKSTDCRGEGSGAAGRDEATEVASCKLSVRRRRKAVGDLPRTVCWNVRVGGDSADGIPVMPGWE